jgi:hypothetical protein
MQVTTVGLDLAKNIFQVHGITDDGEVAFNRALRRAQLLKFFVGPAYAQNCTQAGDGQGITKIIGRK